MSEPVNPPKEMRRVSASRLKSMSECMFKFYANEYLRWPEKEWERTHAGSASHAVLECVYRDYYRKAPRKSRGYYDIIKAAGTIYASPAIARLIKRWQTKTGMSDKVVADIDGMIMLVITATDYLDANAIQRFEPEHEFRFSLSNGGVVKGFLDRFSHNLEGWVITDYKTQRNRFEDEDVRDSFQSLVYQTYVWKTFKGLAEVRYLLLRHAPTKREPFKHIQTTPPATPSQLEGFESYLEHMYTVINNLTWEDAISSYHADEGFCERVCSYRRPMSYISVKKKGTNTLVKNYMMDKPPKEVAADEYTEVLRTKGCPKWNRQ